jgi:hypothetical protein
MTATILTDSVNSETGSRLVSLQLRYPRVVHSEFMTHRVFSRNAGSSRARPIKKMIEDVQSDPYIPRAFGLAQKGMQPAEFIYPDNPKYADYKDWWLNSMTYAVSQAEIGARLGLHKQVVNRLLEPFQFIDVVCSGTDWDNFIDLRTELDDNGNPMADIPIYDLALEIDQALATSTPHFLHSGEWHVPFSGGDGWDLLSESDQHKVAIARAARVSYKTWDGGTSLDKDLELYYRLLSSQHLSPFEHVAVAEAGRHANFTGFKSFRQTLLTS